MQIRQDRLPNRRSTIGYCTFLECNLVTWKSQKQILVARSSTETKYRVMAHKISELTLLRHFLQKIGFSILTPIPLYCYNQVVVHLAPNSMFHERIKYIKVDYHLIQDKILSGDISTPFVKSKYQLPDVFMKSLSHS
jgi:hypothetical protein